MQTIRTLSLLALVLASSLCAQSNVRVTVVNPVQLGTFQYDNFFALGVLFDTRVALRLDEVRVDSLGAGDVVVRLLDAQGAVLQTATVTVSEPGLHTVPLGFNIDPGTSFGLDAVGSTVPGLARNTIGSHYPINTEGVVLTNSMSGFSGDYGPFYDWRIITGGGSGMQVFGTGSSASTPELPNGWINGSADGRWLLNSGPTPTPATGPDVGNAGTAADNYVFFESSDTNAGEQAILVAPPISSALTPAARIDFNYHMRGADTGTLELQTLTATGWVTIFSRTGDQGTAWLSGSALLAEVNGAFNYRFVATDGAGDTSDIALDDVVISSSTGGATPGIWQTNQPEAALTVEGVVGGPFTLARRDVTFQADVTVESTLIGQPFDVFVTFQPARALGSGALSSPGGQILNIDPYAGPFISLSAGSLILDPVLAPLIPFTGTISTRLTAPPVQTIVSAQSFVLDPASADGIRLSQVCEGLWGPQAATQL